MKYSGVSMQHLRGDGPWGKWVDKLHNYIKYLVSVQPFHRWWEGKGSDRIKGENLI
jgi:hypothetical protein